MTQSTPSIDRIARAVVVVASAWFAFTAIWGLDAIPGGGHIGAGSAANAMASEQMVRWKIWYPAYGWYDGILPLPANYYCHHPFGPYYLLALCLRLFGHRDFVVRLPGALLNIAAPPLLYGIAKERWGSAVGAAAAAAYVVVPLAVGYSNFSSLEPMSIFGALLFFWGHSRHMTTGKGRYMAASLAGAVVACSGDWPGYLLIAPTLAWSFVRVFLLPARATPRIRRESYARWWALSVAVVASTLMLWLALFFHANQIGDFLNSGTSRGVGSEQKLSTVLASRKDWLDFSFTPLAIFLGKLAVPVAILRFLIARTDEETYSLGVLFGAGVQYVAFKQGADVHIFWPLYFAPYFALAIGQLAHSAAWIARRLARRLAPARQRIVFGGTALALGLAPAVAMAHDGVLSLWVWRRTGGRYDERGGLIRSHLDMLSVVEQVVMPQTERGTRMDAQLGSWGWEHEWKYQGLENFTRTPSALDPAARMHPFWIGRGSAMSADEARRIAASAQVRIYGDVWLVDQRESPGPVLAYSFHEREPGPLEWLFVDNTEPHRSIGAQPDPWLTWESRTHLGQSAVAPQEEPRTPNEMRIAHNIAIARGDTATAQKWRGAIEARLDRTVSASFDRGVDLVGVRLLGGVQPRIEAWFDVREAPSGDASFDVRSDVQQRASLSLIPAPKTERQMAWPPPLPTKLWKAGFLYVVEVVMNHRIGRERYAGHWQTLDGAWAPQRSDKAPDTTLAIVE